MIYSMITMKEKINNEIMKFYNGITPNNFF